jgi:hypothetical protein
MLQKRFAFSLSVYLNRVQVSTKPNKAPTNVLLSKATVAENAATATVVGNLSSTDPNTGNTFTYTLVAGSGSTNNANFTINANNQIVTNTVFDFEVKNVYTVRVRTTDQGGLSFDKVFTIKVTNVNEAPTNLTLSTNNIKINKPVGSLIGSFLATDPDVGNKFTYTLVTGSGSTDNAKFSIVNNQLKTKVKFTAAAAMSIRVRVTDQNGLSYETNFTINAIA